MENDILYLKTGWRTAQTRQGTIISIFPKFLIYLFFFGILITSRNSTCPDEIWWKFYKKRIYIKRVVATLPRTPQNVSCNITVIRHYTYTVSLLKIISTAISKTISTVNISHQKNHDIIFDLIWYNYSHFDLPHHVLE